MDENASQAVRRSWLDAAGTTVSVACAIQCVLFPLVISVLPFPLLVSVLPFLNLDFLVGGGLEKAVLATAIVLAVGSFSWGFRFHRRFYVFLFLILALGLIFAGRVWLENRYQIPFVVSGALILAAGHIFNRRLCRLCLACRAPEPEVVSKPAALNSSSA
jgi:hypothetical protein